MISPLNFDQFFIGKLVQLPWRHFLRFSLWWRKVEHSLGKSERLCVFVRLGSNIVILLLVSFRLRKYHRTFKSFVSILCVRTISVSVSCEDLCIEVFFENLLFSVLQEEELSMWNTYDPKKVDWSFKGSSRTKKSSKMRWTRRIINSITTNRITIWIKMRSFFFI